VLVGSKKINKNIVKKKTSKDQKREKFFTKLLLVLSVKKSITAPNKGAIVKKDSIIKFIKPNISF